MIKIEIIFIKEKNNYWHRLNKPCYINDEYHEYWINNKLKKIV